MMRTRILSLAATVLLVGFAASVVAEPASGQTGEIWSFEVSEVSPTPTPAGATGTITATVHVGDFAHDYGGSLLIEGDSGGALTVLPMTGTPECSTPEGLPPWISQCFVAAEPGDDFEFTIGIAVGADAPAGSTYEIHIAMWNLAALGGPQLLGDTSRILEVANGLPPGGTFTDDDGNIHEGNIEAIAAEGVTKGCNPAEGNTKFCPASSVTRGQMAAFLARALELPGTATDFFTDDDGSIFENDINRVAQAGITEGCNPLDGSTKFCPDGSVTRGMMAAFLTRAFGYTNAGGGDIFEDDDDSIFENDIDKLATAGVTKGCNPSEGNTNYCPSSLVSRDQMASLLARALKLAPVVPPPPVTTTTATTTTQLRAAKS